MKRTAANEMRFGTEELVPSTCFYIPSGIALDVIRWEGEYTKGEYMDGRLFTTT